MISIIICSINVDYLKAVCENILKTIGMEHELLIWDNRLENKGICEVYNLMAQKAKFPYLCFIHEDIILDTKDWGVILYRSFLDQPDMDVIGVAGSTYKSGMLSGWTTGNKSYDHYNFVHRINGVDHIARQPAEAAEAVLPVVCIDGVFIACRREVWKDVRFDADKLKGFHFYDIDFSLRAAQKNYGVGVTMKIDLTHITQGGDYGNRWVKTALEYHADKAGSLPYYLGNALGKPLVEEIELGVARHWLDRLKNEKISLHYRWEWIRKQGLMKKGPILWYPVLRFLVFEPFKLKRIQKLIGRDLSPN